MQCKLQRVVTKTVTTGHAAKCEAGGTVVCDQEHNQTLTGGTRMCPHTPLCPDPKEPDREAARTIISHPEQGWSLLCNGIVVFEDTGELLPDGFAIEPHRPTDLFAQPLASPLRRGTTDTSHSPAA